MLLLEKVFFLNHRSLITKRTRPVLTNIWNKRVVKTLQVNNFKLCVFAQISATAVCVLLVLCFCELLLSILERRQIFLIAGTSLLLNFQPSSKKYFEDFCDNQENTEVEFMRQLFNERSILFLGCDPNREEYMSVFRKFAVSAQVNYASFPNQFYHTTGYPSGDWSNGCNNTNKTLTHLRGLFPCLHSLT